MRNFGIIVVCVGLALMILAFLDGAITGRFSTADWAGIAIGAWFSFVGCLLVPSKKRD